MASGAYRRYKTSLLIFLMLFRIHIDINDQRIGEQCGVLCSWEVSNIVSRSSEHTRAIKHVNSDTLMEAAIIRQTSLQYHHH